MRQALRILGISFWSLLSLEIFVGILDWSARWTWVKEILDAHPYVAAFARTPFVYLLLLILGFVFLRAEHKLKLANIHARFVNARVMPNLHTATMKDLFDTEEKKIGWDERKLDWWWFVEIKLANESDTPTTIDTLGARVLTGRGIFRRRQEDIHLFQDVGKFKIDMGHKADCTSTAFSGEQYRQLPSLIKRIANVPLTRGIGYRGWLRCEVKQVSQKDMNSGRTKIDVWLIDALQGKHKVHFKKKSDHEWDQSFLILEDKD